LSTLSGIAKIYIQEALYKRSKILLSLFHARVWISNDICCGLFVLKSYMTSEVHVWFVVIGGIVDHHCLNFLVKRDNLLYIGRTLDFHFEATIMILHLIHCHKLLIQVVNIYFLSWKFDCFIIDPFKLFLW